MPTRPPARRRPHPLARRAARRAALVVAALVGAALVATALPSAAHAQFGTNLIVNGGGEASPGGAGEVVTVPGWTTTVGNFTAVRYGSPGGFPDAASPGPAARGENFFAGGDGRSAQAVQTIDLAALGLAADIDARRVRFDLSGYFGGFSSQGDNAFLLTEFLDAAGGLTAAGSLGGFTAADRGNVTGLLLARQDANLFVGTRAVRFTIVMSRLDGVYNDGYVDNLSFVLSRADGPTAVVPEPTTFALAVGGGLALALAARRRRA